MKNHCAKAIIVCGGAARLGKVLGVSSQVIVNWRARGTPIRHCSALEKASRGIVNCEQLRPDLPWLRIADADWPWHPKGRPVLDMTKPKKLKPRTRRPKPTIEYVDPATFTQDEPKERVFSIIGDERMLDSRAELAGCMLDGSKNNNQLA